MSDYTPMPKRRDRVRRAYPVYSLEKVINIIKGKCGDVCIAERHGKGPNKVVILPEPWQELKMITSYGRKSPMNVNEQKIFGMGHFITDENGNMITVISHFIEVNTMNRTPYSVSNHISDNGYNPGFDFLEYYREEFKKGEAKYNTDAYNHTVDPFLRLCGPSEFVLDGHTHPNLGAFYSTPDKETGAARAAASPICIFVCDPIRKEMLGSIGTFAEAEVIVFSRADAVVGKPGEDKRLIPPTDDIVRLSGQCLRTHGYSGHIRLKTRIDGKVCLKIKLIIPKKIKERKYDDKDAGEIRL